MKDRIKEHDRDRVCGLYLWSFKFSFIVCQLKNLSLKVLDKVKLYTTSFYRYL